MGKFVRGEIRIKEKIKKEVLENYIKEFLEKRYLFGVPNYNGSFGSPNLSYIRISNHPPKSLSYPAVLKYQLLEEDRELFIEEIADLKEKYGNKNF